MDSQIAIEVNHLSKAYKMYDKPVDRLKETLFMGRRTYHRDFYALDDVSFQVKRGETLGIIGRNGAGKSTLLKIITGVLQPTSGEVKVNGRISSLLELGAGFNPEFTGIENIYLNGTVMGFSREEMDERVQDILDFADIGDFVYQPVKTYSSGMYVRLAFAVAINVNPEILIVDEALAVGDAKFTLKCLAKIDNIKKEGATILLVTHGIEMLKQFADKALLLNEGKKVDYGNSVDVSLSYYKLLFGNETEDNVNNENHEVPTTNKRWAIIPDTKRKYGRKGGKIDKVEIEGFDAGNVMSKNRKLHMQVHYSFEPKYLYEIILMENVKNNLLFGMRIENEKHIVITDLATSLLKSFSLDVQQTMKKLKLNFDVEFPKLASGEYWFSPELAIGTQQHLVQLDECVYLFSVKIESNEDVLGLMKFQYNISI